MNKKAKIIIMAGAVSVGMLKAREIRTPLLLYPNFTSVLREDNDDRKWNVDVWSLGYHRIADKAFKDSDDCPTDCSCKESSCRSSCASCACDTNCKSCSDSRKTPLSRLFFCKSNFRGEEAFANATVDVPANPWLNISTMKPRVCYTERGVMFGASFDYDIKNKVRLGVRVNLPFAQVEVKRVQACGEFSSDLGGERREDVVCFRPQGLPIKKNPQKEELVMPTVLIFFHSYRTHR